MRTMAVETDLRLDASPHHAYQGAPPVHGVGELGWSPPPPVYGHQLWRRLEYRFRGRYWKVLPRWCLVSTFYRESERLSRWLPMRCWANSLTTNVPEDLLAGPAAPHERAELGENKTDWQAE